MPQTSKNNFKNEEKEAGVILELPKNVGCTNNNTNAPSITHMTIGCLTQRGNFFLQTTLIGHKDSQIHSLFGFFYFF